MQGFKKFNLRDLQERMDPEQLESILSAFSCPYNRDVEDFLHSKAVEFSKQRIASVYLVFASYREELVLVGHFALTQKYFHIDLSKHGSVSSNLRRRIRKFATYDDVLKKYIVTAPLIDVEIPWRWNPISSTAPCLTLFPVRQGLFQRRQ